jgi:hypothetical protein
VLAGSRSELIAPTAHSTRSSGALEGVWDEAFFRVSEDDRNKLGPVELAQVKSIVDKVSLPVDSVSDIVGHFLPHLVPIEISADEKHVTGPLDPVLHPDRPGNLLLVGAPILVDENRQAIPH